LNKINMLNNQEHRPEDDQPLAGKSPRHVVIFPDGNRRWAKEKGLPSLQGHLEGYKKMQSFYEWCKKRGVKIVTVFGFSTENWNRTKEEVDYLMNLLENFLAHNREKYREEGMRVRIIGQKYRLPESTQKMIEVVEEETKNNKNFQLNMAISYGGRWDIVQAVQKIIEEKISAKDVSEELINSHLSTAGLPDPDMIIRAGKEKRISNFVIWQATYSELFFSDKLWPDFGESDLEEIFEEYNLRQRRFGK